MAFFARRKSSSSVTTRDSKDSLSERKKKAMLEPEWSEVPAIKTEELNIWTIDNDGTPFPVEKENFGIFNSKETYIVLKSFNKNARICFNLHFWMGLENAKNAGPNPPEAVTQLSALLNDKVVVFREIEGFESNKFKSYFKLFCIQSGIGTGNTYDPAHPEAYRKRLLHFCLNQARKRVEVSEVPVSWNSLTPADVYIYDEGRTMTQWNGSLCDEEERIAARKYIETTLRSRRGKCRAEFYDQEDLFEKNEFRSKLKERPITPREIRPSKKNFRKAMLRLSDESKKLVLTPVYMDKIYRNGINIDDVNMIETFNLLFVNIGPGASENERSHCWEQADKYLKSVGRPNKAVAVFEAGVYLEEFNEVWDDFTD